MKPEPFVIANELKLLQGMGWVKRFIKGETISKIAKKEGKHRVVVARWMRRALDTVIQEAQGQLMAEVFPLAKQALAKHIEAQLKRSAKTGEPPDLTAVERFLEGLYVYDSPPLQEALATPPTIEGEQVEPDTLTGFVLQRRFKSAATPERFIDANSDSPVDGPKDDVPKLQDDNQGEGK